MGGEWRGACVPLLINQAALLLPRGPENCLILHHCNALRKGAPFWSLLRSMLKARRHGEREIGGCMEMGGFREIGGYREVGYIRDMGGYRKVGGLEETTVLSKMGGQREMCSYVSCVMWL